jgi:hypothetical protein
LRERREIAERRATSLKSHQQRVWCQWIYKVKTDTGTSTLIKKVKTNVLLREAEGAPKTKMKTRTTRIMIVDLRTL